VRHSDVWSVVMNCEIREHIHNTSIVSTSRVNIYFLSVRVNQTHSFNIITITGICLLEIWIMKLNVIHYPHSCGISSILDTNILIITIIIIIFFKHSVSHEAHSSNQTGRIVLDKKTQLFYIHIIWISNITCTTLKKMMDTLPNMNTRKNVYIYSISVIWRG
jgi:hypothetical protein